MKNRTRRRILQIHGSLMILLGVVNAAGATIGLYSGGGPMGFLHAQPFVHVGLIQAYLLIVVVGCAMWMGAKDAEPHKWHRIGAGAHLAIVPAYLIHWNALASYSPDGAQLRAVIVVHLVGIAVESYAAFTARKEAPATALST
jgi:hypothetical protein